MHFVPAAQMFTLRQYTQTPEGLEMCFRRLAEMGFSAVQLSTIGPQIPADFITALCREYGLEVCATHTPLERILNDLPAVISEHRAWGCTIVGLGNPPQRYTDCGYPGYARLVEDLRPAVALLKENGMKFAYHSHSHEFQRGPGGRLVYDMLVEDTDPDAFTFIQDTFWMRYAGLNHLHYIQKVAGRMDVLHVKDFTLEVDHLGNVFGDTGTLGEGNIDYRPILRACRQAGVRYLAIEQDYCARDPFACMADALAWLNRLIEENRREAAEQEVRP